MSETQIEFLFYFGFGIMFLIFLYQIYLVTIDKLPVFMKKLILVGSLVAIFFSKKVQDKISEFNLFSGDGLTIGFMEVSVASVVIFLIFIFIANILFIVKR